MLALTRVDVDLSCFGPFRMWPSKSQPFLDMSRPANDIVWHLLLASHPTLEVFEYATFDRVSLEYTVCFPIPAARLQSIAGYGIVHDSPPRCAPKNAPMLISIEQLPDFEAQFNRHCEIRD